MKGIRPVLAIFFAFTAAVLPAARQSADSDFSSRFFTDLGRLFGRLQQAELDGAFRRAKSIRCSDLVSARGEWKQVAFLNDDRRLGDWHYEKIEEVRADLTSIVFSGSCRGEDGPVKVETSHPVAASIEDYRSGKIRFSAIVIRHNPPVSVLFDASSGAYRFDLPFLYASSKEGSRVIYSDTPPQTNSTPERDVSEECLCKAVSDPDLTYRFLLCRNSIVYRTPQASTRHERSLGGAAYYILSDGREASSSVKLTFESPGQPGQLKQPEPDVPAPKQAPAAARNWTPASPSSRLVDISAAEFRLHFDSGSWTGRIDKPQLLRAATLTDLGALPSGTAGYCIWQPSAGGRASKALAEDGADPTLFTLQFRNDPQASTATFEAESLSGGGVGSLQCVLPEARNPAEITVGQWNAIAGPLLRIEVPR